MGEGACYWSGHWSVSDHWSDRVMSDKESESSNVECCVSSERDKCGALELSRRK